MIIDGQKWKFYPQKVFDFPKKANFDARLKEHNFDKIFFRRRVAGGWSQKAQVWVTMQGIKFNGVLKRINA